jgi:hypothetical protein
MQVAGLFSGCATIIGMQWHELIGKLGEREHDLLMEIFFYKNGT